MEKLLLLVLILSGCHICHEELRPLYMCLGMLPFIGVYFKSWWTNLHTDQCIHDPITSELDIPEVTKISSDIKYPKFDPILSLHPFVFIKSFPYVLYDTHIGIESYKTNLYSKK